MLSQISKKHYLAISYLSIYICYIPVLRERDTISNRSHWHFSEEVQGLTHFQFISLSHQKTEMIEWGWKWCDSRWGSQTVTHHLIVSTQPTILFQAGIRKVHDLEQISIVREKKKVLADCWVITPKLLSLENENLMMWCEHRNEIHNLRFETRLWKTWIEKGRWTSRLCLKKIFNLHGWKPF